MEWFEDVKLKKQLKNGGKDLKFTPKFFNLNK